MKFRIHVVIAFVLFGALSTVAQDRKNLTMEEAILGYHLYPRGLNQLQWVDDTHYSYLTEKDGATVLLISQVEDTKNGLIRTVSLPDLENAMLEAGFDSIKRFPRHTWINSNEFKFFFEENMYKYHIGDRTAKKIGEFIADKWEHAEFDPIKQGVAYVMNDNLHFYNNTSSVAITTDGGNGIVYGQAVHRSEFGITNGIFWSPKGNKIAFYRMDETMVTDYPIYDLGEKPAKAVEIKYPVAGAKSHHVTLGVYNTNTGKTVYMQTGEPLEQYLTNISWDPNEEFVYIAVVNRAQNHMWLKQFNAETGAFVKTLFDEENERYVEPEHTMTFLKNEPNTFVWWSERDGYDHLYLYNTEGKMLKQLTKGDWVVTDFYGFNTKEDMFYISATKESPLNRDLYCVNAKSGKMKLLSIGEGSHRISPSPNNVNFIDNFTSTITPLDVRILKEDGSIYQTLKEAENPLKNYNLGEMTIGTLKAQDGVDLYYRLFKPTNFDPNKRYPVIVYLYGGPHLQLITNSWLGGANLWYQYLAEQGYVVFSIDNHGSSNRGFAFESAIHRNAGTLEMEDQLVGVNWLKTQSWVDSTRMGVHGWSFGGFMTTSLMTRKPGTFKVGVAGGPVIDWQYYEIMYTERYMDTPEENPEGYKTANLLNYVDKLEGKLLMIHGTEDDVVLWQHSLMYVQKAVESGVQNLDYFVYPNHKHNVYGRDRLHLYQKVTDYLMEGLKE